jgi:D-sedoheptulose 7-phosphate isomerase
MAASANSVLASQRRLDTVATCVQHLSRRVEELLAWSTEITHAVSAGHRLLAIGNGGGCALADHFVAELVGNHRDVRPPIDAVNLQASTATLTALSNDFDFKQAAARAVAAHGRAGDIVVCISASGTSENLLNAAREAKSHQMRTFALIGRNGRPLADIAERTIAVEADDVATVQELQLMALHVICHGLDVTMAGNGVKRNRRCSVDT